MDPVNSASAGAKVLSAMKDAPLWALLAVTLSLGAFIFIPQFALLVAPSTLAWIRFLTVVTAIFGCSRGASILITKIAASFPHRKPSPPFHLTPVLNQCLWNTAKQPDGSTLTQITAHLTAKNMSTYPLALLSARLIKPRIDGAVSDNMILIRAVDSRLYGTAHISQHIIPPGATLPVSAHIMIRGIPRQKDGPMDAVLGIIDDEGRELRVQLRLICANSVAPASTQAK
jgi:hypothetical protein